MKAGFAILILALDFAALWERATRETNSAAANRRGVEQFAGKQYVEAARDFARVHQIEPTARSAFNLGTAEVASGKREEGSATLTAVMNDPALRAAALYNRGNSALASHAYEHAVRDYIDVLKLRPADADAKRNLEIALRKKEAMQRSQSQRSSPQSGQQPQPQSPEQQPAGGEEEKEPDEDAGEALLRSAQQQEQEELSRMRRSRPEPRRVGW